MCVLANDRNLELPHLLKPGASASDLHKPRALTNTGRDVKDLKGIAKRYLFDKKKTTTKYIQY